MSYEIIHKSLHRPQLFKGVDRELGLSSALISFIVAFSGQNVFTISIAIVFWFVSIIYLRRWAKADPLLKEVFLRFTRKQDFYSASSSPFAQKNIKYWK